MSLPSPSTLAQLTAAIDLAWADLQTFLGSLSENDSYMQDSNGWNVKDHTTHMAVWEDSVAILFRGKPRHEALGIAESFYREASFDQINEVIKERYTRLPYRGAVERLDQVHKALMAEVRALSDSQLKATVRDFFSHAPRTDERTVSAFIYENTADHFTEHLQWMRSLLKRAD